MTEKSVIRDRLWHSVEVSHYKTVLIIYTLFIPVLFIYMTLRSHSENAWIVSLVILGIIMVPVYLFHAWRFFQIFRCPEEYIFCPCQLSQFHYHYFLKANSFTVVLDIPGAGRQVTETRAIFQNHGLVGPLAEDYVNKTVTIGYNRSTQTVVVIG